MTESGRTDPLAPPEKADSQTGRKRPVPKQKKPGPYRVPPRDQRHGLLIVNTGDGKGKTTAALGVLLRAYGRDMRVAMLQFVKNMNDGGEHHTAQRLGIDILPLGNGCTLGRTDLADDATLAREAWAHAAQVIASGEYDVLILDELTLPIEWQWLDEAQVIDAFAKRPHGTHIIVTGRNASQALIDAADLVTDMRLIKHPFRDRRLLAQAGIDV